ncbi:hypothetical protein BJD99_20235 [Rhodococcus sp. 1163]|nr:hypothetical protein BJD99_20235 [Rhodococcus sp. 1163]
MVCGRFTDFTHGSGPGLLSTRLSEATISVSTFGKIRRFDARGRQIPTVVLPAQSGPHDTNPATVVNRPRPAAQRLMRDPSASASNAPLLQTVETRKAPRT